MVEGFLLGVIATSSLVAALFFLKFWRKTRDSFFLWFAASFFMEGLNRAAILLLPHPNEGSNSVYLVRVVSFLLILVAIVRKNYGPTKVIPLPPRSFGKLRQLETLWRPKKQPRIG